MPRKYEKVQELLPAIKDLQGEGYTYRQIAERLGSGGKEVDVPFLRSVAQRLLRLCQAHGCTSKGSAIGREDKIVSDRVP